MQDNIAHEVLSRAKQLHWTWTACNELAVAAINGWPHLLPRLQREWCSLFLRAAEAARTMQRSCMPAGEPRQSASHQNLTQVESNPGHADLCSA